MSEKEENIVKVLDILKKCHKAYFENPDYDLKNDHDLTFEEYMIFYYAFHANNLFIEEIDVNQITWNVSVWKYCLAHYTQPIVFDKPWEEAIVDRCHSGVKNVRRDENGKEIHWTQWPEYKDKFKQEIEEIKRKQKQEYDEWIAKKEKQNLYQRARRARIKEEKMKLKNSNNKK